MTIDKAKKKIQSAMCCHPNAVQTLLAEALELLDGVPAVEPAQRCNCCGYLVTDSEHRGCLRAAKQEPAQAVPVAEVLWFDPRLDTIPRREPYKIIDASMAWMDQAEIGTKLYDRPPTRKLTDEEIKLIKGMIEVYEYKALQCDRMSNPLAARQKEKELERVALLRKILGEQE